jgi:hypothetical protein
MTAEALAVMNELLPAGYLTVAPNPINLEPTAADGSAVKQTVGVGGGILTATGPGGTVYTLDIPPNAIAFPTAITMTPLSDVAGFPADAPPEHRIGVELGPNGLQLRTTATLTIQASETPRPSTGSRTCSPGSRSC